MCDVKWADPTVGTVSTLSEQDKTHAWWAELQVHHSTLADIAKLPPGNGVDSLDAIGPHVRQQNI